MNYDAEITKIITAIKADKTIVQPWRNKTIARLDEAQAFIAMGKRMTNRLQPSELVPDSVKGTGYFTPMDIAPGEYPACICPPGARDSTCPIHGK